jgi:hypothetical protein
MHVSTARLAAFLCVGFAASSLALAAPASANNGTITLTTNNGQVGVNQVLTATYVSSDAGVYCEDEGGPVSFNFTVQNGPNLGTVSGTCAQVGNGSVTPVATWTGTMNWTPTKPGAQLLTTQATQQLTGGAPVVGDGHQERPDRASGGAEANYSFQGAELKGHRRLHEHRFFELGRAE